MKHDHNHMKTIYIVRAKPRRKNQKFSKVCLRGLAVGESFLFFLPLKFPETSIICLTDKMPPQLHSKSKQNKIHIKM